MDNDSKIKADKLDEKFLNIDSELLEDFLFETKEHLENIEMAVLTLEGEPDNKEVINAIFRGYHTIKGIAAFEKQTLIQKIAHQTETLLDKCREGFLCINKNIIDLILKSSDIIKSVCNNLGLNGDSDFCNQANKHVQDLIECEKGPQKIGQMLNSSQDNDVVKSMNNCSQEINELLKDQKYNMFMEFKNQFVIEVTEHIEKIEEDLLIRLEKSGEDYDAVNDMFRSIHSIKGGVGILLSTISDVNSLGPLVKNMLDVVHSFESLLVIYRDKHLKFNTGIINVCYMVLDFIKTCTAFCNDNTYADLPVQDILDAINKAVEASCETEVDNTAYVIEEKNIMVKNSSPNNLGLQSIRVNEEKISIMMNSIAELTVAKNSFLHLAKKISMEYNISELTKEVKEIGMTVNRISDELQTSIMSIRMIEIKTVFQKMPRIVRDISQLTNKKINLVIEGENTEIDKTIIEQISDPLIHIIRNSADHGIEDPDDRVKQGKKAIGTIILRAFNKNKSVFIEVEDDGQGIDCEVVKKKVIEKGLIKSQDVEKLSKSQVQELIFLPGFSTAKQVTEVSGRGVGMDIVRSNIIKLNGSVKIDSEVNKGTKMTIQLPLTLAVSKGLIVDAATKKYIIPIDNIIETMKINLNEVHVCNERSFTHMRGEIIGIEWLSKLLLLEDNHERKEEVNAVIISDNEQKFAVIVDKLVDEQEFIIKPLKDSLAAIPGIAGTTLLGDGQVVLVLNPVDLISIAENEHELEA